MRSLLTQPQRLSSPNFSKANRAAMEARRPSINYLYSHKPAPKNVTPQTTQVILNYMLDQSIQSRLKHADLELDELSSFPDSTASIGDKDVAERRRCRIERAANAEKDKSAVESLVAGVLSDHRTRLPPSDLSTDLQHRLYLAQLTNLVYSRYDALPSSTHIHHHLHSSSGRSEHAEMIKQLTEKNGHLLTQDLKRRQQAFENPIHPHRCRRHRALACDGCNALSEISPGAKRRRVNSDTILNMTRRPPPGLIDAIPPFLKTSAMALRRELEEGKAKGGMPTGWYDLFLDLLTQAAIESYFCDGRVGLEPILEIFAYGDTDDAEDMGGYDSDDEEDEDEDELDEEQSLRAADYHLLFPKTRVTIEFAKRLRERESEFSLVNGTLEQHFQVLANKYPSEGFERGMRSYIDNVRATMETPSLGNDKNELDTSSLEVGSPPASSRHSSSGSVSPSSSASTASSNSNAHLKGPTLVLIGGDGAILMPDVPSDDEDDGDDNNNAAAALVVERDRRDSGNESAAEAEIIAMELPGGSKRRRED